MPQHKGCIPPNFINRVGLIYGKLTILSRELGARWLALCECGNTLSVLSTNLANYSRNGRGCKNCALRIDITGERIGKLIAVAQESGVVTGRPPQWVFHCDCGNEVRSTVREFHAQWVRSCGCIGNAHASWSAMMARCYDPSNNRFKHYGGRGIRVCERWHTFSNFLADMGERPKDHTLSRLNCERNYTLDNCIWEHITKNTADTCHGKPTKPGLAKGARVRSQGI
jgi:hypothetical protein